MHVSTDTTTNFDLKNLTQSESLNVKLHNTLLSRSPNAMPLLYETAAKEYDSFRSVASREHDLIASILPGLTSTFSRLTSAFATTCLRNEHYLNSKRPTWYSRHELQLALHCYRVCFSSRQVCVIVNKYVVISGNRRRLSKRANSG